MRSGTTTLYRLLTANPEVAGAQRKEVRFFDLHFDLGLDWYREQFAREAAAPLVGEASQTYMFDSHAAERLLRTLPHAKLIAILRDPVDRAYSHYWFDRSRGREPLDFADALDQETARFESDPVARYFYSYVRRGRYHAQLKRLCDPLDADHLYVVLFDDLRDKPHECYRGICRFLGVDESFVPTSIGDSINGYQEFRSLRLRRFTKAIQRRDGRWPSRASKVLGAANRRQAPYPPMPSGIRTRLAEVFHEDNLELSRWLERDLAWSGMCEPRLRR